MNPASAAASPSYSTDGSPSAPSTIGQDGSDFTTQATLSSLTARPTNNIVNTNSFYDVVFLTATSGTIKTIHVTFPAGTTIPSGAFFNEAQKCVPGSDCTEMTGTVSRGVGPAQTTITYTVTNPVNVPAGTKIRLEFANINNPVSPGASYKVVVITTNPALVIIDGPTESTAYTIKQIGVNAIADGHITTSKIADGAVTTPKIADGAITTQKIASGSIVPFVNQRESSELAVSPGSFGTAVAPCLGGEQVVGGGYGIVGSHAMVSDMKLASEGVVANGWAVEMANTNSMATRSFVARAECMPALP
jgi:hypothetical protein